MSSPSLPLNKAKANQPPMAPMPRITRHQVDRLGGILAFLLGCYQQAGPIFRFRMPGSGEIVTVMAGQEANQFMNRQGREHISAHTFRIDQNRAYGAEKTLVSMDGDEHRLQRQIQQNGYSRQLFERQIADAFAVTLASADQHRQPEPQTVHQFLTALVADQIGTLFLDYPPGDVVPALVYFLRSVVQSTLMRSEPLSKLAEPKFLQARQQVWELANAMISSRQEKVVEPGSNNLIDDLVEANLLNEADLRIAVIGPYIAGLDAVANSCSFILYSLLADPGLMQAVRQEIDTLFAQGLPSNKGLRQLTTLQRVVMESLRLYPIAPALQGTVTKAFEFAGYHIAAGEPIIVASAVTHFLPEFYAKPETFDIQRYAAGRHEHRTPGAFAAYGLGPHSCLGGSLADAQMMLTIATLLHAFDFQLEPAGYQLKVVAAPLPCPSPDFRVLITPRPRADWLNHQTDSVRGTV